MKVRVLVKDPEHKLSKGALMGLLLRAVGEILKPDALKSHRGGWYLEIDEKEKPDGA